MNFTEKLLGEGYKLSADGCLIKEEKMENGGTFTTEYDGSVVSAIDYFCECQDENAYYMVYMGPILFGFNRIITLPVNMDISEVWSKITEEMGECPNKIYRVDSDDHMKVN